MKRFRTPGEPAPWPVVLVVEDERIVRDVQRDALENDGCAVIAAASALEALAAAGASTRSIDVLVTDLSLPGLRGCELAARMVAERPGLGVVFTSGFPDDDRLGDRFPGSTYLQKPFTLQELSAAVAAAVR